MSQTSQHIQYRICKSRKTQTFWLPEHLLEWRKRHWFNGCTRDIFTHSTFPLVHIQTDEILSEFGASIRTLLHAIRYYFSEFKCIFSKRFYFKLKHFKPFLKAGVLILCCTCTCVYVYLTCTDCQERIDFRKRINGNVLYDFIQNYCL